jgi:hypothetical protein
MTTRSTLSCEIDLDAPGKRHGFLRPAHSTHAGAQGLVHRISPSTASSW